MGSSVKDRGKVAEAAVEEVLKRLSTNANVAYQRVPDARAARGLFPAQPADFIVAAAVDIHHRSGGHWLEVKETQHEYRLAKDKLPQLPVLRAFHWASMDYGVIVYHSTLGKWRFAGPGFFGPEGMPASWNLSDLPLHNTAELALQASGWFG